MTALRIKVVERGDGYKILRFPFWASEAAMQRAAENVRRDAEITGRSVRITVGHKLMRVEGDLDA